MWLLLRLLWRSLGRGEAGRVKLVSHRWARRPVETRNGSGYLRPRQVEPDFAVPWDVGVGVALGHRDDMDVDAGEAALGRFLAGHVEELVIHRTLREPIDLDLHRNVATEARATLAALRLVPGA